MEVEMISTQLIKPSIPTAPHLRYLQLSFLDQRQPLMAIPIILFYPKSFEYSNIERCDILKNSLLKALSLFYPLAGRLKGSNSVDCNNEGALLVEAKANCPLSTILAQRNASVNENFVPRQCHDVGDLVSFFQITLFSCGGLAVSFAISHKLGDGASSFMFLKSWVEIAKGNDDTKPPQFGFSSLFRPSIDFPGFKLILPQEKQVTKLFTFSGSALAALKAKYEATYGEKLSSVEALTVFIWSRFMASTQTDRKKKRYTVCHWMDLRPKFQLPDSKVSIGNLLATVEVEADMDDTNDECYGIVKRMKYALRNVDLAYIKKLQNGEQQLKIVEEMSRDEVCFQFSSLLNHSTYETDFGWGKLLSIETGPSIFHPSAFFAGTKEGEGIDAWIGLKEEDMAKFEADRQLLAYLSSTGFSRM